MNEKNKLRTFWSVLKVLYFLALAFFICFLLLLLGVTLGLKLFEDIRNTILREYPVQTFWVLAIGYLVFLIPVVAIIIHTSLEQCREIEEQDFQMQGLEKSCNDFDRKIAGLADKIIDCNLEFSDALYDINNTSSGFEALSEKCMKESVKVNNKLHKLAKKSNLSDFEDIKISWQKYDNAWNAIKPLIK